MGLSLTMARKSEGSAGSSWFPKAPTPLSAFRGARPQREAHAPWRLVEHELQSELRTSPLVGPGIGTLLNHPFVWSLEDGSHEVRVPSRQNGICPPEHRTQLEICVWASPLWARRELIKVELKLRFRKNWRKSSVFSSFLLFCCTAKRWLAAVQLMPALRWALYPSVAPSLTRKGQHAKATSHTY